MENNIIKKYFNEIKNIILFIKENKTKEARTHFKKINKLLQLHQENFTNDMIILVYKIGDHLEGIDCSNLEEIINDYNDLVHKNIK